MLKKSKFVGVGVYMYKVSIVDTMVLNKRQYNLSWPDWEYPSYFGVLGNFLTLIFIDAFCVS